MRIRLNRLILTTGALLCLTVALKCYTNVVTGVANKI